LISNIHINKQYLEFDLHRNLENTVLVNPHTADTPHFLSQSLAPVDKNVCSFTVLILTCQLYRCLYITYLRYLLFSPLSAMHQYLRALKTFYCMMRY